MVIQGTDRKIHPPTQNDGAWASYMIRANNKELVFLISDERCGKTRASVRKWLDAVRKFPTYGGLSRKYFLLNCGFLVYIIQIYKVHVAVLEGISLENLWMTRIPIHICVEDVHKLCAGRGTKFY